MNTLDVVVLAALISILGAMVGFAFTAFRPDSAGRERRYTAILNCLKSPAGATPEEVAEAIGQDWIDVACDLHVLEMARRVRCEYVPPSWGRAGRSVYRLPEVCR